MSARNDGGRFILLMLASADFTALIYRCSGGVGIPLPEAAAAALVRKREGRRLPSQHEGGTISVKLMFSAHALADRVDGPRYSRAASSWRWRSCFWRKALKSAPPLQPARAAHHVDLGGR